MVRAGALYVPTRGPLASVRFGPSKRSPLSCVTERQGVARGVLHLRQQTVPTPQGVACHKLQPTQVTLSDPPGESGFNVGMLSVGVHVSVAGLVCKCSWVLHLLKSCRPFPCHHCRSSTVGPSTSFTTQSGTRAPLPFTKGPCPSVQGARC